MNSIQIASILNRNRYTKRQFRGVYASDTLISQQTPPYCCVVNSDKQDQPGTHWMAIYVPKHDSVEFFDSFAESPNSRIEHFLSRFPNRKFNRYRLQSEYDTSCGSHVIYFLVNRCRGESFDTIINRLAKARPFTDSLVKLFVANLVESI
jgi:hypothetical protein